MSFPVHRHQNCDCGKSLSNRRHFLKSLLPGGLALAVLQSAGAARAENHQAKALVLSCIDFRFLKSEIDFLLTKNMANNYDWTALAGASLALEGFPHEADAQAFWDQLDLSYKLHHIQTVMIIDHEDCGAYANKIDRNLSQDKKRELQVHTDYLNRAYSSIRNRYPDISVELYFASLKNPGQVMGILPIHPA
jgi:carbonic anhydrase